ncbi:YihY/virulence factor BrkB family protein [Ostreibacterium oceani]|uniref:YihY family inner membrane protein n=1 Tax=Ostreibacterium oceani TaxID=2654998 RepID=A0A6N7EYU4_9GAMM|nr:YihY/virulence factor BrkB family protein [Ostreibacterium oceani]MPV86327.1 YihY family inner membrane protein [Ostreibacterium oceani]
MTLLQRLEHQLWQQQHETRLLKFAKICLAVWRIIWHSRLKQSAASLTYSTLLAIIPLLAILFTLLKSFGMDTVFQSLLLDLLAPMGNAGTEVAQYIRAFVDNTRVGVLGGVGLVFLFYSIFALFRKIEATLNHIWHVDQIRPFRIQIIGYLGAMMLTVIISAIALGLNLFFHKNVLIEQVAAYPLWAAISGYLAKAVSIIITALLLAILYAAIPNAQVKFRAAFAGGLFCTLLWLPLTAIFTKIIIFSSSYSIIYSSFASLIILLIWLNILWVLFLSGGLFGYFVQFPSLLKPQTQSRLNPAETEYYAAMLMQHIIANFKAGNGPVSLHDLIHKTQLTQRQVLELLHPFLLQGFVLPIHPQRNQYALNVDYQQLTDTRIREIARGEIRGEIRSAIK